MAKRYGYSIGVIGLTAVLLTIALRANGGMIFFTLRSEFESQFAPGAIDAYNFNNFTAPRSFAGDGNLIDFEAFTLHSPEPTTSGNFIAVGPFDDVNLSVDGTPYAEIFLNDSTNVEFAFAAPVVGFGGDYFFRSSTAINFSVFSQGQEVTSFSGPATSDLQFFGFISTDPFDRIHFQYSGPQGGSTGLALDNIVIGSSVVPEPASLLLLGVGVTLLGGYGYSRWRRQSGAANVAEASSNPQVEPPQAS